MITNYINFDKLYKEFLPDWDKTTGVERLCRSPFREDKHPSFSVNAETGLWHDFGTQDGGNATQFYAKIKGISTKAAYKELLHNYPIVQNFSPPTQKAPKSAQKNVQETAPDKPATTKKPPPPPIAAAAIERFTERLQSGVEPYAAYVRERFKRRGIELHICANLRIGITDDNETLYAYAFDGEGNCTAYKKVIHREGEKTRYACSTESRLFPSSMLAQDKLVLCEGESDLLCLLSHGINAVTGTAGANTFKPQWAKELAGKAITILYDNDEAGREGVQKVLPYLPSRAKSIAIAELPEGVNDVGAFFEQNGTIEQLHEILASAIPVQKRPTPQERTESNALGKSFVYIPLFNRDGTLIHRAVAETVIGQHDFCASDGGAKTNFYEYKSGCWQQISAHRIRKIIIDTIGDTATTAKIKSVLDIIADYVHVDTTKFDARNDLLNLQNCAFDLLNYKPLPHCKEHYFSHTTDYCYDADADCPTFHTALETYSMRDREWVRAFWEILGFCLTGGYEFQKMFWFFGGGANGKGTVLRVMQNLVGTFYTRASIKTKQLDDQFYKGGLINKRLAIAGEIPSKLANISAVKELSGGDRQSTDVKFGQQIDFENKAKLVFAMNRMPTFPSSEPLPPILRRIHLLPFEHRITTLQPDIEQKFHAELPGIFNHAVKGLKRLREQQAFTVCERGKRQLDLYAGQVNTFGAFITDKCTFARNASAWGYELWDAYKGWMDYHCGAAWQNDRDGNLTNSLLFLREVSSQSGITKQNQYCREKRGTMVKVYGIKLKTPVLEEEYDDAERVESCLVENEDG